jgi:cyclopropane fatty-acyl-phospholipid synthase-like methyltransferase
MKIPAPLASLFILVLSCAPSSPAHPTPQQPHPGHDHGMPHRFENAAQWASVFDDPARDAWQRPEDVVRAMSISPGMSVADIGAGTGYFLPHLARAVGPAGNVVGVDIEPDMVRHMNDRASRDHLHNVHAVLTRPDDPGLPERSVDRVLIVDTWHHIPDRGAYAAKLARTLTDGGMIFIVDFTLQSSHGPPRQHRLPPDVVIEELRRGGLDAQTIDVPLPDQYVVVARKRR